MTYNVSDEDGFDFSNDRPIVVGWDGKVDKSEAILPAIIDGGKRLQDLVDEFSRLGLPSLKPDELMDLVIEPTRLAEPKTTNTQTRRAAKMPLPGFPMRS